MSKAIAKRFQDKEFFGHPAGLFILFLTEMWERFSFYGMRSLLVLYMATYLLIDPAKTADIIGYTTLHNMMISVFGPLTVQQISSQLYGLYTGFVYLTPLFGGMIADRLLGQYRTVYLGGLLMAIGHFLMASESAFLLALFFLILGNGCFKPNISTQVGTLYKEGDPRRDRAFAIFYMGINLGAFFAPFICGTLGQKVGWHWGFGAAGVGMLLGLLIYWIGRHMIPKSTETIASVEKVASKKLTKAEWNAIFALGFLCLLNIVFWAVYEQQGNTLQLWADQRTDWMFLGWQVPSSWFQAFNPFMIFIFTPVLAMIWGWQSKRKKEPNSIVKMGIGCILCGAAYIVMMLAAYSVPADQRGSVMWLVVTVFMFTIGEIFLSPIGLSLVTKVAPKPLLGTMMGIWFLSSFFGNYATGLIGMLYDTMAKTQYFMILCLMGVITGVVFFMVRRPVEKAIGKHV